jgi:hypothetical protein
MKCKHGFSQAQVASNLDYLIEQGFVARVLTPRTFHTSSGTTQSSEKVTYKIAKPGSDRLEGNSEFRASNAFSNINITTLNSVVAVGNGNAQKLVQRGFEPIIRELDALQQAITDSELPEERKISAIADVQTIEYQLAKPQVNRSILKEAWTGVEKAVTVGKAAELVIRVGQFIAPLLAEHGLSHI